MSRDLRDTPLKNLVQFFQFLFLAVDLLVDIPLLVLYGAVQKLLWKRVHLVGCKFSMAVSAVTFDT